jgi:hypothetical protein
VGGVGKAGLNNIVKYKYLYFTFRHESKIRKIVLICVSGLALTVEYQDSFEERYGIPFSISG